MRWCCRVRVKENEQKRAKKDEPRNCSGATRKTRGVNVRPNPRTRHEPDTGFFGLGLDLNGFGS